MYSGTGDGARPSVFCPVSIGKGQARTMVGQRVSIHSQRVEGATGEIRSYREKGHHFLIRLDEPLKDQLNRPSDWHTCPAGHVKPL